MAPPNPGMTANAMSASAPMPVTGTVQRYYVDRTGFVTAMDVQAADGVKMVRFSPSLASSLTSMYPVGSTASVYVTSSNWGKMTRYDLAGTSATMPAPTAMYQPVMVSDIEVLKAEPFVMLGAKTQMYSGKVTGAISDPDSGEVLAIILDDKTMLRIPRENRQPQASPAPEGVTPLFKGSYVAAYGIPEAPRWGAVSPFAERVVATSISVNGHQVGALGFGKLHRDNTDTLFGFNIPFFGGGSPVDDPFTRSSMGYTAYSAAAPAAM
ncbi:hypothetical protein EON80_24595 [bacterium]|nr:MAG: hypothetical protein EON80_24595 [bacterium]